MDLSLLLTLGIIFLATLVGYALRGLSRDRCLKDFDGSLVSVERKDKPVVGGTMHLEPTGFELEYPEGMLAEGMHIETSHLFYKSEYANIRAICRDADDLDPESRKLRDRAWGKAFHPGLPRLMLRRIRNLVNTATDSLSEALNLLLGQSKPLAAQQLLAPGQTHLKGLTKDVLGYVGVKHDPLLERLIGVQVVAEQAREKGVQQYVGVLKDYSGDFLEILDVYLPQIIRMTLETTPPEGDETAPSTSEVMEQGIRAAIEDGVLIVENSTSRPVLLRGIKVADETEAINAAIGAHDALRHPLPSTPQRVELVIEGMRQLDIILARASALIRHRAERQRPTDAPDPDLTPRQEAVSGPERIRLASHPADARAALDLGILLLQHNRVDEAIQWLGQALVMSDALSDEWVLASQQLERARRRRQDPSTE